MTDEQITALVERLREAQCPDNMGCNPLAKYCQCVPMDEAADMIDAQAAEIARLREEPTLTITRAQYDEFVESAEDHTILWTDTLALIGVYVAPCQTKIDVQDSRPNKGQ
jgi:hypothetical protein